MSVILTVAEEMLNAGQVLLLHLWWCLRGLTTGNINASHFSFTLEDPLIVRTSIKYPSFEGGIP